MRLMVVGCVLMLVLSAVLADDAAQDTPDKDQDEEEYEDIAVAESQDIGHSRLHPNSDSDDIVDRPRSRPRGRKRRRRLRKKPRSTTPSFIEEYNPERTVKEEELSPVEEDVVYQRRRPSKRRRRPIRRKPEYDTETPVSEVSHERSPMESLHDHYDDKSQDYQRPRNPQRRRRKGGRKRIRISTEPTSESNDDTHEETIQEGTTTQPSEVVMQSNNFSPPQETINDSSSVNIQEETTQSIFTSAFTPKEITEINHKLGSITEYPHSSESEYRVSGLGAFSVYSPPTTIDITTQNVEENHIIHSSTTTKDYAWINRFNPQIVTQTTTEEIISPTLPMYKFGLKEEKNTETKNEPVQNIKNIEKIIENRKNLFSKSRRLPPTSAVIRRRIRPRKLKNSTTAQTIIDNTEPTMKPKNSNNIIKPCQNVDCALNLTSLLSNNIVPSALLPSGFPTMPEILSPAELIHKISNNPEKKNESLREIPKNAYSENTNSASSNLIIITPSTLIRSLDEEQNGLSKTSKNNPGNIIETIQPNEIQPEVQTDISTSTEATTKSEESTTLSSTETTSMTTTQTTTVATSTRTTPTEQEDFSTINQETSTESENLKLDGVDVSNIDDEILELIMDEMGKARVKRILELRNMTLSELIAHRERGAGHFSAFINENRSTNNTEENSVRNITETSVKSSEQVFSTQQTNDEEKTEQIIVEKAKQFMNEYKKSDDQFSNVMKSSQKENEKFGKRLKVEGTVIPVPILEPTHTSTIQFPDDGILGAFPKYMYDIAGKRNKPNQPRTNGKPSLFTESINKPREIPLPNNDKREPRVFESMPRFISETSNKDDLEMSPYPDWRITISKSTTEKNMGFPGISKEILLVPTSTPKPPDLEDVILLDEGEEIHHLRNHILGGKINVESGDITDEDYPETKKVPAGVKSAIAASGALLGLAIFGFLAVLVSCKIRQRRARLRARQDILCEHLAEDIRGSQRSLTPVLRKSPFNHTIHSNTASNRHYYLWRTLRKTFQYE